MANTTNLDLVPLDGDTTLKTFPTPYNGNLQKIDDGFGTLDSKIGTVPSGETVEGQISSLNSKITKKTIALTASSGVTLLNENCYEMNGVVCLSFKATGNIQSGTTIASIPSNYAPSITIPAFGISNSDDSFRAVYIGTNGNISAYGANTTDIRITIVYMR